MSTKRNEARSVNFRKYKNMSTKQIAQTLMSHVLSDIEENMSNESKNIRKSTCESKWRERDYDDTAELVWDLIVDSGLVDNYVGEDAIDLLRAMENLIRRNSEAIFGYDIWKDNWND